MKIIPTGKIDLGICQVQTPKCLAITRSPIIFFIVSDQEMTVCKACLEENIRSGLWEVEGARINQRADIAVYDKQLKLQLVIETKNPRRPGAETVRHAIEIRRNLLAHAGIPYSPYFMVAFPHKLFLWNQDSAHLVDEKNNFDRPPNFEISTNSFWGNRDLDAMSESELNLLVAKLVSELAQGEILPGIKHELIESGLPTLLKDGIVLEQEATVLPEACSSHECGCVDG
jgi:hypothetical protein